VNSTLHRRDGAWDFDSTKTASSNRTVTMLPLLMNVLAQHRESQTAERLLVGEYHKKDNPKGWVDWDVVFATHKGGPLLSRNVFRDYKKMQKQANLREQTYHDLRHGAANLMMNSGASSLAEVSKILGHSQLSITAAHIKQMDASLASQRTGEPLSGGTRRHAFAPSLRLAPVTIATLPMKS
jgi:integrase